MLSMCYAYVYSLLTIAVLIVGFLVSMDVNHTFQVLHRTTTDPQTTIQHNPWTCVYREESAPHVKLIFASTDGQRVRVLLQGNPNGYDTLITGDWVNFKAIKDIQGCSDCSDIVHSLQPILCEPPTGMPK